MMAAPWWSPLKSPVAVLHPTQPANTPFGGLTQSLALHPWNVWVERRGGKSATGRDEGLERLVSTADMG